MAWRLGGRNSAENSVHLPFWNLKKPDAMVRDFWVDGEWNIPLRRCLGENTLADWEELQINLADVGEDTVVWSIEKSHSSTKSLYYCLTQGGVKGKLNKLIWKCKIPVNVEVFLWQVFHNKLQTAVSLVRRGWHGSPMCCVCHKPETVDHVSSPMATIA